MTRIRRINVSQVEGGGADNTDIGQIRPAGETAFYIDDNNKLTLMMFDGVRTHRDSKVLSPGVLYGSNADAGDNSGSDTIKLIPDAGLGTDQYIVVDPTGGEPGHIHLRAGGTIDNSTAELYLGGENNHFRVNDNGYAAIRAANSLELNVGNATYTFSYDQMVGSSFQIAGGIQGPVQTSFLSTNGLGISIDGYNTPNTVDIGNIPSSTVLRLKDGDGAGNIIVQSLGTSLKLQTGNDTTWELNNDGSLTLPGNLNFPGGSIDHVSSIGLTTLNGPNGGILSLQGRSTNGGFGSGIDIWSSESLGKKVRVIAYENNATNSVWEFKLDGSIDIPRSSGPIFTFSLSTATYVPTEGKPTLTLSGSPWELQGQYSHGTDGQVSLVLNNIWPTLDNPGYTSGDAFAFNSSNHGQAGYTLTITLNDVVNQGPAGWTANVSTSAPPEYPSNISSNGAIKFTANDNNWILGTTGNLTLPNNAVIRVDGDNVEVGNVTNFNVEAAGVVNIYTDTNGETPYQWQFGDDGSLIFPDATVQETAWAGGRVVAVPTHSTGAIGDQQGDLAFTSTNLYYCTAEYNQLGHQVSVFFDYLGRTALNTNGFQLTKTVDTLQITVGDIISDSDGGATSTVVTVTSDENYTYVGTGGVGYNAVFPLTFTSTDYVAGGNIWKRIAWSGDIW